MKKLVAGVATSLAIAGGAYWLATTTETPVPPMESAAVAVVPGLRDPCGLTASSDNPGQVNIWWTAGPREIVGVHWDTKAKLAWAAYDRGERGEIPATITYEIAQGDIGDWTPTACVATGLTWSNPFLTIGTPSPGTGTWFLVRVRNACGSGTWGANSAAERPGGVCGS